MAVEDRFSKLKILKDIAEKLNEGTDLRGVLHDVLTMLLSITEFKTGWIFLIDKKGKNELAAYENLPSALTRDDFKPMCSNNCWCVSKFMRGTLDRATNIMECKRLEDAIHFNSGETFGLTHHATVPLRAGDEAFGLLNVASPHKSQFNKNELDLLESVAYQIGTAIKRIQLHALEQETAIAAERNRLARDLHDSVNQLLFSVSLTARAGKEMSKETEIKETFGYIQEMSQTALAEMKALIWQLRPKGLENGVVHALTSYGNMIGLKVHSEIQGLIALPSKVEEAIWRIGQEAFNNCKKHSGQKEVFVRIRVNKLTLHLEIWDKGKGCLLPGMDELPSMGLETMKERTRSLNGTFRIDSMEEKGTRIIAEIPIQEGKT
ncbi:two-component system NarL family sensor kinase [Peribacillus deserti]|uniref:histidine kinase n=1 Tax=Peribacillus deserti TaxID=673318 RepID=A0ABS2QFN1_9BACI|nr:two-component system NarL family sensor kinase [Peribacillus deserti]